MNLDNSNNSPGIPSPSLLALAQQAIDEWPEFDSDDDVNGGDLVEWFGRWRDATKKALAAAALAKRPSLAIIMEGGVVQDVVTDMPEAFDLQRFVIIDYDTDGADEVMLVPQSTGTESEALVTDLPNPTLATIPLDEIDDWETFTRVDGPAW
jgi:hypothetical protein